jgi:hypothetical protein
MNLEDSVDSYQYSTTIKTAIFATETKNFLSKGLELLFCQKGFCHS